MGQYNMFSDLKTPRDVTGYTLFRGTTDWSQLQQFDLFEGGYPLLVLVSIPEFLKTMADRDPEVAKLVNSYQHIIEYEFKGFDSGLENITADSQEINSGTQAINVITRVNAPTASTFSMTYMEKSGSTLTKMHELYLRSISDPATTYKTYNGLIGFGANQIHPADVGWHKETFTFLYMHTDKTGLLLERAVLLIGCQPQSAELSIYNATKGNVEFKELSCEFSGFPIYGSKVNAKANEILQWCMSESNRNMIHRNSWDYDYEILTNAHNGLAQQSLLTNP
ncbi:hypothetical protein [uncultured Duncaniella sp.]|uniref:hypothetical protein n=1 Tax=uncultured Duncaniella sp. TaxID=2768039 RepID=UPI002621FFE1|nr:hypothetical protein [uncultured Duncaniella sp.]